MSVFKKILSLTLVFLLVFSCLPTAAFADEIENETEVTEEAAVDDEVTIQEEVPAEEPVEESPEEPPEEEPASEESEEIISEEVSETVPEDENEEPTEEPDPEEDPEDETDPVETEAPEDSEGEEISEEEEPSVEEETDSEPVSEEIEEDTEQEAAEEKPEEEPVPVPCIFTVELQDVRDNITIRRNGQIVAAVYGNPAPGDGHYFIVGPVRLEELSSDPDGNTRLSFEALTGDEFTIETVQPVYANIRYYSPYSFDVSVQNGVAVLSIILEGDTSIQVNGDYSAAAGFFPVGVRRALRASGVWTPPDAIYVSLGNCYDTYSSTAIVNGHTGVYFFEVEDLGEGHFVSATCGSTTKHMVSGTHYKVARIAEYAARQYLDYGSGCCSQRAQRALAWITYHGQSEYDWRRYNENRFRMGDDSITVNDQLEAYTITFLAAWVCTNDGRVGSYGTVHAEDGAHALDFMFGSSFSTGLPASTRNAIDLMVSKGLAFADTHPDPDANLPEYQYAWVYSDGYADHQPLLIGSFQGPGKGTLTITKKSSNTQYTSGNNMYSFEGTTFQVKDSNGNVAGTLVANASGKTGMLELDPGTYTVTETKVGKGYIRNTETKTITVNAGDEKTVSFTNVPMKDPAMLLIRKWDVDTDSFVPQGNGSFAGARYRLDYYDNTDWSGTPKASWVLESDSNGVIKYLPEYKVSGPDLYKWGDAYLLPLGSIKITEVKAPEGYRMSTDVLYATITQNGNDGILKWTTETQGLIKAFADGIGVPENAIYGGVRFKKVDRETGKPVAGAEISIYSNCDADILVDGSIYSRGDLIVTLTTNENGTCETGADYLPYGSYYAVETKASDKYLLNEEWRVDFNITENGKIVDLTTGDNLLKEQIIRGDLSMLKLDIDGHYKPNIPFMIVQIDENGEEGEWHVIVTDENGMIDTSAAARPHTNSTNSLDQYVDGGVFTDASKLDPTVGIWFGDSQPDNSLGALPYGNYKVYELQTEQLAEEQINILESKIIEIHEPGVTVVLSPMVNLNIDLKSEAASAGGKDFIPAAAVRVVDTVHYTNLTSYRRYTMETQFVLKSTSEVLATISKDFYPPEGPAGTNTAKGSVTLEAEIDVTDHPGDCVVACDYLYEYVKGTKILIASHANMEDKAQTLKIPDIHTTAHDSDTGDNVGTVSEDAGIIDTVYYTNLKRGEVFVLVAKLGDSEAGEIIKDSDGEDLTVEKRFVCWKEEGSVEMPAFEIDSTQYAGRSVVVLEELYWVDEEHDNEEVLMTVHESFDDADQTIYYPEIHTTATDINTGEHVGVVSEVTVIEDIVQLTDLIVGQEYTVTGVLVYKEDCTDAEGKTHKAGDPIPVKDSSENSVTFIADAAETEVTLTYVVDSSLLEGTTAVVFEDLIHSGIKVASHADLEDKEQTVHFPKLKTQAIDKTSGTSFVTKGSEVYFVDTVSYSNVVPGLSYVIKGELIDKNTGEKLACYAVSDVFVPTAANGTVQVEFLVDSERIPSTIIVVFEDLYLVKEDGSEVLIDKHEDLNDEDQSLYHPEIRTTAVNAETGTHEAQGNTKTVLKDTVAYSNLKPGEEYTVIGILMDKATGNPIVINGERVTSKAVFTPTEKDGFVEVTFEFDATRLVGKTTVVFEKLLYEGIEIVAHADIEDEGQSVNIIDIRTSAVDSGSNSHEATWDHKAKVIDTVTYTGITPGKTYTVCGTVMLKGTGEVLIQNGIPVTGMTEFVPEETDGTVEVSFVVDTYLLQGMEIVVFERLFAGSVMSSTLESDAPIAVHEDINDKDQTIKVPVIPFTPPHTGVEDHTGLLLITMLTSGVGAIWIFSRKKKH